MSSMQQFSEKVIAITGAASGIGLATAMLLASRGATLSIADVQAEPLRAAERAIAAQSPGCALLATILDVRDAGAVEAWIEATVSRFGRLDGAANVAGVVPRSIGGDDSSLIEKYDMDEYDTVMGVNARGLMLCLKYQLAAVGKGASIVNAASIAGLIGRAKNASYAASKHAVVGLTRSAAKEVGPRGVRVNCICPGRIDTPMFRLAAKVAKDAGNEAQFEAETNQDIALMRMGRPEEVATLFAFLLSDEASYISGTSMSVDGGWHC